MAVKRKTSATTQKAAESYVRRASQVTKKAPSARLKKRRTVNLQTPKGVFPNPARRGQSEIFRRANELIKEGYERKQAFAIAYSEQGESKRARRNPSTVHFDIDVNSHNARGSKAKTRTNPSTSGYAQKVRMEKEKHIAVEISDNKKAWQKIALFPDTPNGSANALEYAKAYSRKEPTIYVRVITK